MKKEKNKTKDSYINFGFYFSTYSMNQTNFVIISGLHHIP